MPTGSVIAPVWLAPALTSILIAEITIETEVASLSGGVQPEEAAARVSQTARIPALASARATHDPILGAGPEETTSPACG